MEKLKKYKSISVNKRADLIFYCCLMAWPVLQFAVFWVGVNANSILMAFQETHFDTVSKQYVTNYFTFNQFMKAFKWFGSAEFLNMIWFSIKAYVITSVISIPLGLLFSFYVFKRLPGWSTFRVLLYLPGVLSGVVVSAMFRLFLTDYLPYVIPGIGNLLEPTRGLAFPVLMIYNLWIGFGSSVLLYSNKMSTIADEVVESANLDGATGIKEFWYIVLPHAYPTVSLFLVTGAASIFLNQYGAYDMFGGYAASNIQSIGYWFYVVMLGKFANSVASPELPYYAALGILLTFITLPLMLITRWVTEKFGPSED